MDALVEGEVEVEAPLADAAEGSEVVPQAEPEALDRVGGPADVAASMLVVDVVDLRLVRDALDGVDRDAGALGDARRREAHYGVAQTQRAVGPERTHT